MAQKGGTQLLKDINPGSGESSIDNFTQLGSKVIFTADNVINGTELWVTDGTTDGTFLLKDINPNGASSFIYYMTVTSDNKCYFVTTTPDKGTELWVTDGTTSGTFLVKDIKSGSDYSYPSSLTAAGNKLFFSASDDTNKRRLWVTDGTEIGTIAFNSVENPSPVVKFNDKFVFSAFDNTDDAEIWISDGTPQGTQLLKNISLTGSSYPENMILVGNNIYFIASNGVNGKALNNLYVTKEEKERTLEMTKQEVSQYKYFIVPVRNKQGEKLGYDLSIYAGGKVYQSSIR